MITKEDAAKLWEQAKVNGRALDGCVGPHAFEDQSPERTFDKKYRCKLCGGATDSQAKHWYERGLEHGRLVVRPFADLPPAVRREVISYLSEKISDSRIDREFIDDECGAGTFAGLEATEAWLRELDREFQR